MLNQKIFNFFFLILLILLTFSCTEENSVDDFGSLNQSCYPNLTCNDDLECKDNKCIPKESSCTPSCQEWESCNSGVCEILTDRCLNNSDCENDKICDDNHNCIIEELPLSRTFALDSLRLNAGESIKLKKSMLIMQNDGNLVFYNDNSTALWHTSTQSTDLPYHFRFSDNGNLVVRNGEEAINNIWQSYTNLANVDHLVIDDKELILYDINENIIWRSNSTEVDKVTDLVSLPLYYQVNVKGYYTPEDGGGGVFRWIATQDKSKADGAIIIDPSKSLVEQGTGVGVGCWVRFYSGAVNVLWFGVDKTGNTNNQRKLLRAFNYKDVLIPADTLVKSSPIDYPNTLNLEINGVLTFANTPQNSAFILNGEGSHIFGVGTIRADIGDTYRNLIKVNAHNIIIENIKITAINVVGDPGGSECTYSDGCHGITYGRGAIYASNGDNLIVQNCEIHHWFGAATYLDVCTNCKILNNYFHDNTLGIFWGSGRDLLVDGNRIIHNKNITHPRGVLAGGSGIVTSAGPLPNSGPNPSEGIIFTNNEVAENGEHGTYIHTPHATITGNNVHDNYYQGIKVDCPGDVLIENNTLKNNDPNYGDGDIYIQARWQMNGVVVKNNNITTLSTNNHVSMKAVIYEWHESAGLKNIHFEGNRSNGYFHVEYTSGFEDIDNTYNGHYFHQEGH